MFGAVNCKEDVVDGVILQDMDGGGNWIGLNIYLSEVSSNWLTCFNETDFPLDLSIFIGTFLSNKFELLRFTIDLSSSSLVCILEESLGAVIINDDMEFWLGDESVAAKGENGEEVCDLIIDLEFPV